MEHTRYDFKKYYLVHRNQKWEFGLVQDAASIQHVRHEGDGTHTAWCVHHIHNDSGKHRGLYKDRKMAHNIMENITDDLIGREG